MVVVKTGQGWEYQRDERFLARIAGRSEKECDGPSKQRWIGRAIITAGFYFHPNRSHIRGHKLSSHRTFIAVTQQSSVSAVCS